jgi:hypothetical protein
MSSWYVFSYSSGRWAANNSGGSGGDGSSGSSLHQQPAPAACTSRNPCCAETCSPWVPDWRRSAAGDANNSGGPDQVLPRLVWAAADYFTALTAQSLNAASPQNADLPAVQSAGLALVCTVRVPRGVPANCLKFQESWGTPNCSATWPVRPLITHRR